MLIEKWKLTLIASISLLLTTVFFLNIKPNEFLFSHDELLAINYYDAISGLYVRSFQDLNVDNTVILTVTLIDRIYYYIGFLLNIKLLTLEKAFYFIKIFVILLLPYIGFSRFAKSQNDKVSNINDVIVWLITFLYAFNTYTTIYWHGNAFQFSLLICYSLAPLAIYSFQQIINNPKTKLTSLVKMALLLFIMSFSVYFFAVFSVILITYYLANLLINFKTIKSSFLNLIKLAIISIPLYAIFTPMILTILFGSGTVNATGGETFTNLQGGLLYPLFLWFSWGIYNNWTPKNIFTFSNYYRTPIYLLGTLTIYLTIFWRLGKKTLSKNLLYFLITLLVCLTFVKGAQPPFEIIYKELIERFPPFRVFRSPDNKFGFGIVLSLCFLLLYSAKNYKKHIFIGIMVFIVSIQAFPMFSGIAIKGQNTSTSSDRVIHIPKEYNEVAEYLNTAQPATEYVLPIPPANFSHFILSPTEKHLGQDLVPKLVKTPFITPDEYSSIPVRTYDKIQETFTENLKGIREFPIKYFLIRKDLEFITPKTNLNVQNKDGMQKVFENSKFILYENMNAVNLIEATGVKQVEYTSISPVEYRIKISGITEASDLIFNTNYSKDWKIYITKESTGFKNSRFNYYPNNQSYLINTENELHNDYSNKWAINRKSIINKAPNDFYKISKDNSLDAYITIYYQPQTKFYLLASITIISMLIYATFIVIKHDK